MGFARRALTITLAGALGCGALVGIGDPEVGGDDASVPTRQEAGPADASAPDTSEMPKDAGFEAATIIDGGEAGGVILFAGDWRGTWVQDLTVYGGNVTMSITQNGTKVSGTASFTNSPCGPFSGTVAGVVDGMKASGTFTSGDYVLELDCTIRPDGKGLDGRFKAIAFGACTNAQGNVTMTRP